ncbi:hypothetical protein VFPPC_15260 [Pochonia chlamydosporia 170]|uniref:Uncharacterized protein n=1 Tax=Pochonia chlamydosporia 170 TaxID=1380566 RepID=A0A179G5P3_METCM|nr:hypothetical protein VFPPC_15260 [Pochonia chlamydosporia 170]OAQ73145.1 hypothetical protein VFPPC_15260 [Pochonia chlamydosporia 170]
MQRLSPPYWQVPPRISKPLFSNNWISCFWRNKPRLACMGSCRRAISSLVCSLGPFSGLHRRLVCNLDRCQHFPETLYSGWVSLRSPLFLPAKSSWCAGLKGWQTDQLTAPSCGN